MKNGDGMAIHHAKSAISGMTTYPIENGDGTATQLQKIALLGMTANPPNKNGDGTLTHQAKTTFSKGTAVLQHIKKLVEDDDNPTV